MPTLLERPVGVPGESKVFLGVAAAWAEKQLEDEMHFVGARPSPSDARYCAALGPPFKAHIVPGDW